MEDVAVTIFRLIIIALILVGVVRRNKRKRTTDKDFDSDNRSGGPTEIPWESLLRRKAPTESATPAMPASRQNTASRQNLESRPNPDSTAEPQHRRQPSAQKRREAYDAETVAVDADRTVTYEYYKKRNTSASAAKQTPRQSVAAEPARSTIAAAEGSESAHGSDTGDIIENFNLRDAVIYSEILKPKFDEQA